MPPWGSDATAGTIDTESNPNVVPVIIDIGIVFVVLMVLACLAMTGHQAYNNWKRAMEAKQAALEAEEERKLEKIRAKKLKKYLARADEENSLKSEESFLGKLGVMPTPKGHPRMGARGEQA